MSFLLLINYIKLKYQLKDETIIWQLIYKLSKLVKNHVDFTKYRHHKIDFSINSLKKHLNEYVYESKPIELITKQIRFYGLDYKVLKGVLVPRPDTEILCEQVIQILSKDHKLKQGVDLCCGCGNIGITLKKNIDNINMDSVDIQSIACRNTKLNAYNNHVKLKVIKGDFFKTLINKHLKYDFIVCNPPYVKANELHKSMYQYENKINFNNSKDHLFFYKTIIDNYQKIIKNKKHFLLAFEIGYNQKNDLQKYLRTSSLYKNTKFYRDYNGNDRVMIVYVN